MSDQIKAMYELSRNLNNPDKTKNDMNEAMMAAMGLLKERYVDKVTATVNGYMEEMRENPSREVSLLYSLKPFMPEKQRENIDKAADMFMLFDAMRRLQAETSGQTLSTSVTASADDGHIIHEDGVYEIDRMCVSDRKGASGWLPGLMMMAAMSGGISAG
jgi:hypothetical protein